MHVAWHCLAFSHVLHQHDNNKNVMSELNNNKKTDKSFPGSFVDETMELAVVLRIPSPPLSLALAMFRQKRPWPKRDKDSIFASHVQKRTTAIDTKQITTANPKATCRFRQTGGANNSGGGHRHAGRGFSHRSDTFRLRFTGYFKAAICFADPGIWTPNDVCKPIHFPIGHPKTMVWDLARPANELSEPRKNNGVWLGEEKTSGQYSSALCSCSLASVAWTGPHDAGQGGEKRGHGRKGEVNPAWQDQRRHFAW